MPNKDEEVEGELVFFDGQLNRILNLDETGITLDGNQTQSGGRPTTKFGSSNKHIPDGKDSTNKSGYRCTFIGGSTVAGYPLPPHFQLKTATKENEKKKINTEFLRHIPNFLGVWGFGKETRRGGTLNCNVTAGMDGAEFFKYLEQSVVTLFPDARNIPGKRVMIIVDSGPGRNNKKLLSLLRARGFIVVTGVPNTTHVTQATDRNYGPFKDIYRRNLEEFVRYRKSMRKTVKPQDIPLLIFGGKADDEDGAPLLRSAFDHAFAFETNRKIWRTIGIFPFNRQCLQDSNVSHELIMLENGTIDLDTDPSSISLILYEEQSATAAAALN